LFHIFVIDDAVLKEMEACKLQTKQGIQILPGHQHLNQDLQFESQLMIADQAAVPTESHSLQQASNTHLF